ncbi:hypothetical protein CFC21_021762 [Triticum aestivum]|uniref:DUF4220 domain-containing protein n=2 Tax=Triticum aestivum TaxID=4565 RepID=A0A3B6C093_WHEAT|nr:hypothetical protein CFC21_021762 [Triticum aestivum]
MGFSAFVLWWRSVQVYVAVGGSATAQVLLFVLGFARKFDIPPWVRLCIWLAFLSSDALVIYALAALLNRPTLQKDFPAHDIGNHDLQVFWAPILLIYLSGQPMMTAYNIEDNELWGRTL